MESSSRDVHVLFAFMAFALMGCDVFLPGKGGVGEACIDGLRCEPGLVCGETKICVPMVEPEDGADANDGGPDGDDPVDDSGNSDDGASTDDGGFADEGAPEDEGPSCHQQWAGPFGPESLSLYIGTAEEFPNIPAELYEARISADGTRLIGKAQNNFEIREFQRPGLVGNFNFVRTHSIWGDLNAQPLRNNLGLFLAHGGEGKAGYWERADTGSTFPYSCSLWFGNMAGFDGNALDVCFTATPDLKYLAFCSTRVSSGDDSNKPGLNALSTELWMGEFLDPGDLSKGMKTIYRLDSPSDTNLEGPDYPVWLSDDGNTLLYKGRRTSDANIGLFVTYRPDENGSFNAGERVVLLDLSGDLESFSLPSVQTMRQAGGRADGYFRVDFGSGNQRWYRFPAAVDVDPCR